jgi:glutathione peroxidase
MKAAILSALLLAAEPVLAGGPPATPFASVDGGTISLADYAGRPVLIANTASMCGFTPQYDALQALSDAYGGQGLVVLAVPSDDFRQELATAAAVKEFCALNFDLTLPMTDITPVTGAGAHPVYRWIEAETGWQPNWNFNKVLIGPDGAILGTWGSAADPMGRDIRGAVEAALTR